MSDDKPEDIVRDIAASGANVFTNRDDLDPATLVCRYCGEIAAGVASHAPACVWLRSVTWAASEVLKP